MESIKFNIKKQECIFDYDKLWLKIGEERIQYNCRLFPNSKRLYLLFSKSCNLSCNYCFQKNDNKSFKTRYNREKILKIIDSVANEFDTIVLFGGEPLLTQNYSIIEKVFSRYRNKKFIIFTNGTFNSMYLDLLTQYSDIIESVLISLDGNKNIHDLIRYELKNSKKVGTFDCILNNLKKLIDHKVRTQIQINCTKYNLQTLDVLIDEISDKLEDNEFSIMLNPVKYTDYGITHLELLMRFIELKKAYQKINLNMNSRLYKNICSLFEENKINYTRCNVETSMVVDFSKGTICKCSQNENSIIGKIEKNEIIKYPPKDLDVYAIKTTYSATKCQTCKLVNFCYHGCANESVDYKKCQFEVYDNLKYLLNHFEVCFAVENE